MRHLLWEYSWRGKCHYADNKICSWKLLCMIMALKHWTLSACRLSSSSSKMYQHCMPAALQVMSGLECSAWGCSCARQKKLEPRGSCSGVWFRGSGCCWVGRLRVTPTAVPLPISLLYSDFILVVGHGCLIKSQIIW